MDLTKGDYKIKLKDEAENRRVQEALFKAGCFWFRNQTKLEHLGARALYLQDAELTYTTHADEYFKGHKAKEIFVRDILKGYKLKAPTHVVIWDEEDEDPHKFFTSEEEAKEFMKELSEKSDVVEDSVILVAVKSVQKVSITKTARLASYKI